MKVLLLDIETAPNIVHVWSLFNQNVGINQIVESGYTLSWAAKWLGQKDVMYSDIRDKPLRMLTQIWELIDEADVVVHYNGSKFDIPTLNKEFVQLKMGPPSPYRQIDLLRVARQRFRFASNKLDYVVRLLGLGAKTHHKGHDLWVGCMNGDPKSWRIMERYNKQDVRLLERLYKELLPWIKNHPIYALYNNLETFACPNCNSKNLERRGYSYTKTAKYQRFRCNHCGTWSRTRATEVPRAEAANILVGE